MTKELSPRNARVSTAFLASASGALPKRKTRARKPKPEKPDTGPNIQCEFDLAKTFRLGQLVRKGDRVGIVIDKYLFRDRLSGIWVCWQKEKHPFSPFDKLPLPSLPSALEIISPAPVANLPRDVVIDDSLNELPSAAQFRESTPADDSLNELPSAAQFRESTPAGDSLNPPPKVEEYYPRGKARGENAYYRLYWCDGKRGRFKHIRGGNIHSAPAQERAERVRDAIARGLSLEEILELC